MKTAAAILILCAVAGIASAGVMEPVTWVRIANTNRAVAVSCFWASQFRGRAGGENDRQLLIAIPRAQEAGALPEIRRTIRRFLNGRRRFSRANVQALRDRLADARVLVRLVAPDETPQGILAGRGLKPQDDGVKP